jgi:hypothetical protein
MTHAQLCANLGWGGRGEGAEIAVIADIARHRRDRERQTLTQRQKSHGESNPRLLDEPTDQHG